MSESEKAVEAEIQAKGLSAPRLTPDSIDSVIVAERFYQPKRDRDHPTEIRPDFEVPRVIDALDCLTICVLVLKNGFTIVGKSACASPANFDSDLGKKIAREDARRQIWALEGYALRNTLA